MCVLGCALLEKFISFDIYNASYISGNTARWIIRIKEQKVYFLFTDLYMVPFLIVFLLPEQYSDYVNHCVKCATETAQLFFQMHFLFCA